MKILIQQQRFCRDEVISAFTQSQWQWQFNTKYYLVYSQKSWLRVGMIIDNIDEDFAETRPSGSSYSDYSTIRGNWIIWQ